MTCKLKIAALAAVAIGALAAPSFAQDTTPMGFFVTSVGLGDGANLGGLEGADAHCQMLAENAGSERTWVAYLSTQGEGAVNARDRIGSGPWANAAGVIVADSLETLHMENANISADTAIDENGIDVPFVQVDDTGTPLPLEQQSGVEHDILTGTQADGTAFPAGEDRTCSNWTSNGDGAAMLGHHDRRSLQPGLSPWSAAHPSQGCSQQSLVNTGGSGRFYCFATD